MLKHSQFKFGTLYFRKILFAFFIFALITSVQAQNKNERIRTEFSPFLSKAYYNFNLGSLSSPFSDEGFNPGYFSEGDKKNRFSGRFLLGYKITNSLAIQYGVMRPAEPFEFKNINGEINTGSILINLWSLSLKQNISLSEKLDGFVEIGIGNFSRKGFGFGYYDYEVYSDAHYAILVSGLGLQYKIGEKWDVLFSNLFLPSSETKNQPYVFQSTLGLQYNLKQIKKEEAIKYHNETKYFFPKRFIQIGYGNNVTGFFLNDFVSMNAGKNENLGVPVFWRGDVEAAQTFSLMYQKTAFRTEKLFSLDWGISLTGFQSDINKEDVFALSIFPVMRFYVLRINPMDLYINYSIVGPTYISKKDIDDTKSGPKITYQDFIGAGAFFGKERNYNLDLKVIHYSNGNIFVKNAGVDLPIVFSFGRVF